MTRPFGNSSSAETIPLRTRSFASWQARSASPTMVRVGFPRQVGLDLDATRLEADKGVGRRASEHTSTVERKVVRVCAEIGLEDALRTVRACRRARR